MEVVVLLPEAGSGREAPRHGINGAGVVSFSIAVAVLLDVALPLVEVAVTVLVLLAVVVAVTEPATGLLVAVVVEP